MGVMTAPVVGSGCWPPWMASVSKPYEFLFAIIKPDLFFCEDN